MTAAPTTAEHMAQLLAEAAQQGRRLVPAGGGTKIAWHHDPFDKAALVSTTGLVDGLAHYAGDLVATLPAGTTLAAVNARLSAAGQWLPLDAPFADQATIGGLVASNDSGPRRHGFGSPRDLIVGVEVALADGRVVKAGGRVVKNVAGYDLSRLFCGSHGSLGVITSATFKLAPRPQDSCTALFRFGSLRAALAGAQALAHSPVTPSAVELQGPVPALLVRFESAPAATAHMAATARDLLSSSAVDVLLLTGGDEAAAWDAHEQRLWSPSDDTIVKMSAIPTLVPALLDAVPSPVLQSVTGRAALGVLYLRFRGETKPITAAVDTLRRQVHEARGHLTLLQAPASIRDRLAAAAPAAAASVMSAIKQRFDPRGLLRRVPDGR